MNRLLLSAAPLLVLVACDRPPQTQAAMDPGPVPAEHADGERLFNENCARCHGTRATGTESGPPLVHRVYEPSHHADFAFQQAVRFGVRAHHWRFGDMPPVAGVDTAAVGQIIGYVRWLQRKAGIE